MEKVLVTGASGYVGIHCVIELLKSGYFVVCSVRDSSQNLELTKLIEKYVKIKKNLEFHQLDITEDKGWKKVMAGCSYMIALASPNPVLKTSKNHELSSVTTSAILRLLQFAGKSEIKRVVLTSSQATVTYGHDDKNKIFNSLDWTNLNNKNLNNYIRSKTVAEKAAWKYINSEKKINLELCTICPGFILGPVLQNKIKGISAKKLMGIFTKKIFFFPNRHFNYVDVRDIAKLNVEALKSDLSANKRFLCMSADPVSYSDICNLFKKEGYSFFVLKVPNILVHVLGLFSQRYKQISYLLDRKMKVDNSDTKELLNWKPTPLELTIKDMANSITRILDSKK